jgi:hypothetical protein
MADAFGQMLLDGAATEIIERDDGFLDTAKFLYFAPVTQWPAVERRALRWVRGRVLDAGLGAGRVALELQRRGRSVVGIDISPGAVEVARERGVRDVRLLAFEEVDDSIGQFDTIVMLGNNFGLFGSPSKAGACSGGSARWPKESWQPRLTLMRRKTRLISPIRSATEGGAGWQASYGCAFATATSSGLGSTTCLSRRTKWRPSSKVHSGGSLDCSRAAAPTTWPFWNRRT